jgi:hypothetical protein
VVFCLFFIISRVLVGGVLRFVSSARDRALHLDLKVAVIALVSGDFT